MTTAQALLITIAALLVGVALPVLVQLFVSLRAVQRSVGVMERRLDATLAGVSETLDRLRPAATSDTAAAIGAALVPAAFAAIRSLRTHGHAQHDPESNGRTEG